MPTRWITLGDLEGHAVLSCMDGRHGYGTVGTAGGNAGELVLTLAAAEALTGHAYDAAQIDALLAAHLDRFGTFYMHTDSLTLGRLRQELDARCEEHACTIPEDDEGMAELVRSPREACRDLLLQALTEPGGSGCGHLNAVISEPAAYDVRPALVRDLVQAVYRRLWAGEPRIVYELLHGEHEEEAIVVVQAPGEAISEATAVPLLGQQSFGASVFAVHGFALGFTRRRYAEWLVGAQPGLGGCPPLDAAALFERMMALGDRQLNATVARLAPDLPLWTLLVDPKARSVRRADGVPMPDVPAAP